MNAKPMPVRLVLTVICVVVLLAFGLWLLAAPESSTARNFPFYSPIHPIGDPQIELTKIIDRDNPTVGDEIVYTIVISSPTTTTVRLYDAIPANTVYVTHTAAQRVPGTVLLPDGGSLGNLVYFEGDVGSAAFPAIPAWWLPSNKWL